MTRLPRTTCFRSPRRIATALALAACSTLACAGDGWHATSLDPATQGAQPAGRLVHMPGNALLGTARQGGAHRAGTVFELDGNGQVRVLHEFDGSDGDGPTAGLVLGSDGLYYGTTVLGAAHGLGGVFRIAADGTFELLHSFDDAADAGASNVSSALALGPDGNFYGTSPLAAGYPRRTGTVFRVTPAGEVTILHVFDFHVRTPVAGVTFSNSGRLYGLASSDGRNDCGALYSMALDGSDFRVEKPLDHRHAGCHPTATMVLGLDGKLYGTTQYGGPRGAVGTLFSFDPDTSRIEVLHVFHDNDPVGSDPSAGLSLDQHGNLYGVTAYGGPFGNGAVFKRQKQGHLQLLHAFAGNGSEGTLPQSPPVLDSRHELAGGSTGGGRHGGGTVWRLDLP